ncbi:PEP-CTERM sorting domain-containing protein [Planctomycetota bacterium]
MKKQFIIMMVAATILVATGISKGALMGYVTTGTEVVWTNFDTGAQTSLGPSGIDDIRGLDTSPIDGTLYASDDNGGLWTVNTSTGIGSFIGNMGRRIESLSFAPDGTLYAIHRDSHTLKQINTSTAVATTIGSPWPYDALAFAISSTGRAIAWDLFSASEPGPLFEIDLTDGSTTLLGQVDTFFGGFDFAPDDVLYGWRKYDSQNNLYSIDVDTLNVTFLRSFSQGYEGGRGSLAIIPEPATLILLGLGGLMLRKRKH